MTGARIVHAMIPGLLDCLCAWPWSVPSSSYRARVVYEKDKRIMDLTEDPIDCMSCLVRMAEL